MRTRVRVAAVLCTMLAIVAVSAAVNAHAYVVATTPGINETVPSSPSSITVSFDEPVTIESRAALVVRDAGGVAFPCSGRVYVNPDDVTQIVCSLARPLPQGAYTVAWRVTSADTHVVHGVFSFGVGTVVNAAAGETHSIYDPSGIPATLLRWLVLLGALAIAGALGFDAIVLQDGFPAGSANAIAALRRRCALLVDVGIIVAIVASVGALDVQAAAATGTDAIRGLSRVDEILGASIWGWMWLVRIGALAVIAALTRARARRLTGFAWSIAGVLLATQSLSGHAVVSQSVNAALPVAFDWLHLSAAALWSAGLAIFALELRPALALVPALERDAFARMTVARFSVIAIASVTAIVVTGVYGAVLHVPSPVALVATNYGRIIVLKAALVVPLLILGYRNYRKGRPGARDIDIVPTVMREGAIVFVILGLSAILTGLSLPHA